jgi:[citrate (pro-3S)-lyase] ligase
LYEKFVADWIDPINQRNDIIKDVSNKMVTRDISALVDNNVMLKDFCHNLLQYKQSDISGRIGSIIMKCNPFTLGHRYLINEALKEVELLYIFVVEEDKSIFPFIDRIDLVKSGTKDLKNVIVLPSGKYIISAVTFPTYFQKEHITSLDNNMDASIDLDIYGQFIAKSLDITIRFVGEEPLDIVTDMYNRQMREILPQYGIEVRIIKRKENRNMVISASRVRKLLKDNNFDKIAELVPETTLEYLKNKSFNFN